MSRRMYGETDRQTHCMRIQSDRQTRDSRVPLEYYRYCSHGVPLESLDDLGSFISVNAVHGAPLDHLRGPAQTVV